MVELIWEGREVTHRFFGQTSAEEIRKAFIKYQSDSRFDDLTGVIADFSSCEGIAVQPGDMDEIAAMDGAAAKSNPKIRITVITDHPEITAAAQEYVNSRMSIYPLEICAPAVDRPVTATPTDQAPAAKLSYSY